MSTTLSEIQKEYQDNLAASYRAHDETHAASDPDITVLVHRLQTLTETQQFARILEVGCGTGRYFHAVKRASLLVGIDPSARMIEEAAHPVHNEQITIPVSLSVTSIDEYTTDTPFDLVYSFGVLGEHIPFDLRTARHIYSLLSPNGLFYFTAINPFGKLRTGIVQFIKKVCRTLHIGRGWKTMNLTAYGWNTPQRITRVLTQSGFTLISMETVQKGYPHYLVLARKGTSSS